MLNFFSEISYSIHTNSLTLFVGAGFTKHFIKDAPSWEQLLIKSIDFIKDDISNDLYTDLYDIDNDKLKINTLQAAQILEFEYEKLDLIFKQKICDIIKEDTEVDLNNEKTIVFDSFLKLFDKYNLNIITTNYDLIIFNKILDSKCRMFQKDFPVNRMFSNRNIIHIHGNILDYNNIVITQEDYFKFQNEDSYIKKKVFTLLTETTTVFLGYGLGDFNLNTILNEIKIKKNKGLYMFDMFFVARNDVSNSLKAFYKKCYGIDVIDNCEVDDFALKTIIEFAKSEAIYNTAENVKLVMEKNYTFSNSFLSKIEALQIILLQASHYGVDKNDVNFKRLLKNVLEQKKSLTTNYNEWHHYEHFANWLLVTCNLYNLQEIDYDMKTEILDHFSYSIGTSSEFFKTGYSYYAWHTLKDGLKNLNFNNFNVIREHIIINSHKFNISNNILKLFS
ncbi:SIR2 family protein [Myroides odoratus]|uniref:SIR2 family NAD-dependent protein deacylase n=1 Tax=Myroides odoratus TaxID=256 RepID=UPI00333E509A